MRDSWKFLFISFLLAAFMANAKNASAMTNVGNCSVLGAAGETYVLTQDILNNATSVCMNITADNVVFDCNNHTIDGTDISESSGVYTKSNGVTIKNCILTDWWYGIRFANNDGNTVENVNATSNQLGLYAFGSTGNAIRNSRFYTNNGDGIRLSQSSSNTISDSQLSGNTWNGIYMLYSNYNNVTGTNIYSNIGSGANLSDSDNNRIAGSSIYSNVKYGVILLSSDSNTITNVTATQNQQSGVYLLTSSGNNITAVNSSRNSINGFYLYSSSVSNILRDINATGNNVDGIYFESSSSNDIRSCNIEDSTAYGIVIQLSSNNNFTACGIRSSRDIGLRLFNSDGSYFTDIVIFNSTNYDIYSSGSNNIYFINTTFNGSKTSINNNAVIWVKWYLDAQVIDINSSNPVENANVSVSDVFGSVAFSVLTNSSGHAARQAVTEYNQTPSGRNYYNNYTINVTTSGFYSNQTSENVTFSLAAVIYVESTGMPNVVVKTYTPELYEREIFKPGRILRIRALVDLATGREYLRNSTVVIRDNYSAVVVNNALMANISNITDGYIYEYNYSIPSNGEGIWTINVTATDSLSRKGYGYKRIAVSSLTIQVKLVLNSTSDSIYVPGTGETAFSGLTSNEYASPGHYYAASYSDNVLKAVVFSTLNPISVFTEKGSADYKIGTSQRFANSMVLLAFSKGNWMALNNRIALIERGEFLSYSEPSFAFGLGGNYPLKVIMEYSSLGINKTSVIGKGYNRLVVENTGRIAGKPEIIIERA